MWTAQYIAMRALGDPDAFPSGDIALLRGSGVATNRELEARAEVWRPWRAYAAIYLWRIAGKERIRPGKTMRKPRSPALQPSAAPEVLRAF